LTLILKSADYHINEEQHERFSKRTLNRKGMEMANENEKGGDGSHIEVAVITTSGRFPAQGTDRVAIHQPVDNELKNAVKELKIVDTTNWVARVDDKEIDPNKSYLENGLSVTAIMDYGPREGGGGNE
jgi:acid stress-induced BolA-like protein IbaG/YrbA